MSHLEAERLASEEPETLPTDAEMERAWVSWMASPRFWEAFEDHERQQATPVWPEPSRTFLRAL